MLDKASGTPLIMPMTSLKVDLLTPHPPLGLIKLALSRHDGGVWMVPVTARIPVASVYVFPVESLLLSVERPRGLAAMDQSRQAWPASSKRRWRWRRRRGVGWSTPDRVPDGDTVPMAGYRRWADLLRDQGGRPCR